MHDISIFSIILVMYMHICVHVTSIQSLCMRVVCADLRVFWLGVCAYNMFTILVGVLFKGMCWGMSGYVCEVKFITFKIKCSLSATSRFRSELKKVRFWVLTYFVTFTPSISATSPGQCKCESETQSESSWQAPGSVISSWIGFMDWCKYRGPLTVWVL